MKSDLVKVLGDHIRAITFQDATKSWQDPALVGPPTLEFAPYPKMPGGRRRNDNRQGTIDQDQEFKDFLESLTNPITKSSAPENEPPKEKVKTTPLIEALREKKANKDKPNTKAGRQNRGDGKEEATDRADKKLAAKPGRENTPLSGDKNRRSGKADKAQAAKDAVKILNKEVASSKSAATVSNDKTTTPTSAPERKRGNVSLAKSMLQRDLGVGPTPNRRRGTKREVASAATNAIVQTKDTKDTGATNERAKEVPVATPNANKTATQTQKKERPTRAERRALKTDPTDKPSSKVSASDMKENTPIKAPAPQILKKSQPSQTSAAPKGPAALRAPPTAPAAARQASDSAQPQSAQMKVEASPSTASTSISKVAPPASIPAATSKQAFLKHANPSQGITEPLIEEAMKMFGGIDKVEIDKRKGFAYVDFAEPEGLQKAMAASPIKIAQGAVQVLERKEKVARHPRFNVAPTGPARGGRGGFPARGRGGRGGGRGAGLAVGASGSAPVSPSPAPAAPAGLTPISGSNAAT